MFDAEPAVFGEDKAAMERGSLAAQLALFDPRVSSDEQSMLSKN